MWLWRVWARPKVPARSCSPLTYLWDYSIYSGILEANILWNRKENWLPAVTVLRSTHAWGRWTRKRKEGSWARNHHSAKYFIRTWQRSTYDISNEKLLKSLKGMWTHIQSFTSFPFTINPSCLWNHLSCCFSSQKSQIFFFSTSRALQ